MALIRQNGCPTIFLTLSCTEFDWPELLKEVAETVYRRKISIKEIEEMSDKEKRKLCANHITLSEKSGKAIFDSGLHFLQSW